jgi:hypothetical protein
MMAPHGTDIASSVADVSQFDTTSEGQDRSAEITSLVVTYGGNEDDAEATFKATSSGAV